MKSITLTAIFTILILGASPALSISQNQTLQGSANDTITMRVGQDGPHCGSREIADYGTPTPMVILGSGDLLPKGIYSPSSEGLVHGVYLVFQLPETSDLSIKLGGRLDYVDEGNRTDDMKVYVNDGLVGIWNPYDGRESTDDRGFIYEIPVRFTRPGMNKLLLSMEHLPANASLFYSFSTITLSNIEGKAVVGMDDPVLGSVLSSAYNGSSTPSYSIGEPPEKFPERLLSPGYDGQVHGVSINFDLDKPSDVMARMNCWAWKDENNRNDDIKVYMNGAPVGIWDPYSGPQYYGNKTFLYEVPAKYTVAGANNLTLSMMHLPKITATWYAIYWFELKAQKAES